MPAAQTSDTPRAIFCASPSRRPASTPPALEVRDHWLAIEPRVHFQSSPKNLHHPEVGIPQALSFHPVRTLPATLNPFST